MNNYAQNWIRLGSLVGGQQSGVRSTQVKC